MKEVNIRRQDGVLHITLQRVSKMNSMTAQMYGAIADALNAANCDDDVKCALIDAEGLNFSAGNDIEEFLDGSYSLATGSPWRRFADSLPEFKKPLVAAVQGHAIGIGFTLLLHCDFVIADVTTQLSAPFAKLGLVPEVGSSSLLPARIGILKANEIFVLGRKIPAQEAYELGLINKVVSGGSARSEAMAVARDICKIPLLSLTSIKNLTRAQWRSLPGIIQEEADHFMRCLKDPETEKILSRFGRAKSDSE